MAHTVNAQGASTKVLVVGQVPPPVHGQAVMIQAMLAGAYPGIELVHVPMTFSQELDDVGRFRLGKVADLGRLIRRIWQVQYQTGAKTLYYPPAGPNRVPMWRDIAILLACRPRFHRTILHFHAGGLTDELYPTLKSWERVAFHRAYARPDAIIRMSPRTPANIEVLHPQADYIVPYGIPDPLQSGDLQSRRNGKRLLYVGALRETKGFMVLLQACRLLKERGIEFELDAMGGFQSSAFEAEVHAYLTAHDLTSHVRFLGICTGAEKTAAYAVADIFCFPTFYESEAFSVVLVEALSFGLPIVSTLWRGIPDIVPQGEAGKLVPIRDPGAVAEAVAILLQDAGLRERMGAVGRARYEQHYTLTRFHERLGDIFHAVQ